MSKKLYTAVVTSTGDGRNGHVRSTDGLLDTDVRLPGAGEATNPEQLFAAGYAACFHSALKATKDVHGVAVEDSAVTAEVSLVTADDGAYGLEVTLRIELGGGVSHDDALKAAETAHRTCPYSNATRGNVDVTLEVEVG